MHATDGDASISSSRHSLSPISHVLHSYACYLYGFSAHLTYTAFNRACTRYTGVMPRTVHNGCSISTLHFRNTRNDQVVRVRSSAKPSTELGGIGIPLMPIPCIAFSVVGTPIRKTSHSSLAANDASSELCVKGEVVLLNDDSREESRDQSCCCACACMQVKRASGILEGG